MIFKKKSNKNNSFNISLDDINKSLQELNQSSLNYYIDECNRLSKMTSDEIKNERLTLKANQLINELESDKELYRIFNNILREKKLKKLYEHK